MLYNRRAVKDTFKILPYAETNVTFTHLPTDFLVNIILKPLQRTAL